MRKLVIKYIGEVNYIGTKRYIVIENEKPIADIYTKNNNIEEIAHEYWKELKEYEIIIEYKNEENDEEA